MMKTSRQRPSVRSASASALCGIAGLGKSLSTIKGLPEVYGHISVGKSNSAVERELCSLLLTVIKRRETKNGRKL
jgi:hypothetical protein